MPQLDQIAAKPSTSKTTRGGANATTTCTIAAPTNSGASIYLTGFSISANGTPAAAVNATGTEDTTGTPAQIMSFDVPAAQFMYAENWTRPVKVSDGKNFAFSVPALGAGIQCSVVLRYFVA